MCQWPDLGTPIHSNNLWFSPMGKRGFHCHLSERESGENRIVWKTPKLKEIPRIRIKWAPTASSRHCVLGLTWRTPPETTTQMPLIGSLHQNKKVRDRWYPWPQTTKLTLTSFDFESGSLCSITRVTIHKTCAKTQFNLTIKQGVYFVVLAFKSQKIKLYRFIREAS